MKSVGMEWDAFSFHTLQALFSLLVYTSRPSSFLPLLLIPTLYTQLGLVSAIEHAPSSFSTIVLSIVLALLYTVAFTLLPWSISYPKQATTGFSSCIN